MLESVRFVWCSHGGRVVGSGGAAAGWVRDVRFHDEVESVGESALTDVVRSGKKAAPRPASSLIDGAGESGSTVWQWVPFLPLIALKRLGVA
jgi:hypothetical protein